jgi:hypothetical protein
MTRSSNFLSAAAKNHQYDQKFPPGAQAGGCRSTDYEDAEIIGTGILAAKKGAKRMAVEAARK